MHRPFSCSTPYFANKLLSNDQPAFVLGFDAGQHRLDTFENRQANEAWYADMLQDALAQEQPRSLKDLTVVGTRQKLLIF